MPKKRNFTRRLFLTYSSVILALLLVLFAGVFWIVYNDGVRKEISAQQEFILKTQQQIDTSLQNMDRIANGLLYNESFMQIMRNGRSETTYTRDNNDIVDIMVSLDAPLFQTHRIIAFSPETPDTYFTFAKTGDDHARIQQGIRSYEYYDDLARSGGDKLIAPPRTDPFDRMGGLVYSVARAVTDGRNVYGAVEVQNPYAQLEALCAMDARLGDIVLLSAEGGRVYPMEVPDDGAFFSRLYGGISAQPYPSGYFQMESYQISYIASEYSGWITVMYCPLSHFLPDSLLISVFLLSLAGVLLLTLSLIHFLTRRMTAPLTELDRQIQEISYENLSLILPAYNVAEIDNINQSFQTMLGQLRQEIARNTEARANEERASYIALQSQMNPHMIYNTIAMIESVCYENGDLEASRLCIAFSQMLRYISDNTKSDYSLDDELKHLENYAELMKKRYENQLRIEVEADPSLLAKIVPKFSLQPLVENSIKHGMNRNSRPFHVRVAAETTPKGWRITVSDNGTGFSDEKLKSVFELFSCSDLSLLDHRADILRTKIDNMALNNIYIRWKILMGDAFSIHIENGDASGCRVALAVTEDG